MIQKFGIWRFILLIIAAVCVFGVIALCGDYAYMPGPLYVSTEHELAEKVNASNTAGVIIDQSEKRLIFLNERGKSVNVIESKPNADHILYYSAAAVSDDAVYVSEYSFFENTYYIETERIIKYSFTGKKLGTVLEFTHDYEDNRTLEPWINDILVEGHNGTALCLDSIHGVVYQYHFTDQVSDGSDAEPLEITELPGLNGDLFPIHALFASDDPGTIIVRSASNSFYALDTAEFESDPETSFRNVSGDGILLVSAFSMKLSENDTVEIETSAPSEGLHIPYTLPDCIGQVCFWICSGCLILLALAWIVLLFIRLVRNHRLSSLKRLAFSIFGLGVCASIVVYYSSNLTLHTQKDFQKALTGYAVLLAESSSELLNDSLDEFHASSTLNTTGKTELNHLLEYNALSLTDSEGEAVIFDLISIGEDDRCYLLADSANRSLTGQEVTIDSQIIRELSENGGTYTTTLTSPWAISLTCITPVYDSKDHLSGLLEASADLYAFQSSLKKECTNLMIALISSMIMICFIVFELHSWTTCYMKRRQLRQENVPHAEYSLARPIMFLTVAATSANSALLPIIVKEIAGSTTYADNAFLMSLPVTIYSLGYLVGTPLCKWFASKLPLKSVLCGTAAFAVVGYGACFFSVQNSNLLLFTISIFLTNAALAVSSSYAYALPFSAQSPGERSDINRSIASSFISSSSVIGLLAGTLSDKVGNAAIQLLGAASAFTLLIFLIIMIPKDAVLFSEDRSRNKKTRAAAFNPSDLKRFISDPSVLVLLLCMTLPISMLAGYKNYLFPLFANSSGMDKATISNIVVFCNALIFFTAPLTSGMEQKTGTRNILTYSGVILAGTFIMFRINSSINWAVISLVIATFLIKSMEPATSTFWQNRSLELHTDQGTSQTTVQIFEHSASSLRSSILGGLLEVLGQSSACFVMGIYAGVCTLIFTFVTRIRKRS